MCKLVYPPGTKFNTCNKRNCMLVCAAQPAQTCLENNRIMVQFQRMLSPSDENKMTEYPRPCWSMLMSLFEHLFVTYSNQIEN